MNGGRRDAPRPQRVHLVLHERDERGQHDRGAWEEQRGQLEAERLPGTGGHHGHQVSTFQHGPGGLLLSGPKGLEAEVTPEGLLEVGEGDGRGAHGWNLPWAPLVGC